MEEGLVEINKTDSQNSIKEKAAPPSSKQQRQLPLLLRLTRRTVVFFSLTLLATIIFYITGNKQTFLDSNQVLILRIIASTAITLSFFTLMASIECIYYILAAKKLSLFLHLICYIFLLIVSITISILSLTINLLSEGINF